MDTRSPPEGVCNNGVDCNINYNIASKFVWSNSIARTSFIFPLCTLMTSANKSIEKKNFPSAWKCYKTIGSYVSRAFIEIWYSRSKSCSWQRLEQLLRILRALQTSCVLHISMNLRWRMNQSLINQACFSQSINHQQKSQPFKLDTALMSSVSNVFQKATFTV